MNLDSIPTDDLFAGLKDDSQEIRHPLGQLVYETYMDVIRAVDPMTFYLAWDNLHPDTQTAYQRAGEAVWAAAFQAGADSTQVSEFIE